MNSGIKIQNPQEQRLEQNLAKILSLVSSSLCIYRLLRILVANNLGTREVPCSKCALKTASRKIELERLKNIYSQRQDDVCFLIVIR